MHKKVEKSKGFLIGKPNNIEVSINKLTIETH